MSTTTKFKKRSLLSFLTSPFDRTNKTEAGATSRRDERVSMRPMATSSDVILTSRHSSADLTLSASAGSSSGPSLGGRTPPSKPSRMKQSTDSDGNTAACYGVDTVHSWATVSAGSGIASRHQQLSAWRSDTNIYSTVSLDTSPVNKSDLNDGLRVTLDNSVTVPVPPPRTKRKARTAFSVPPTNKGRDDVMSMPTNQSKPCEFVAPPPPPGNPPYDVANDVISTQVYLTRHDSLTSECDDCSDDDDVDVSSTKRAKLTDDVITSSHHVESPDHQQRPVPVNDGTGETELHDDDPRCWLLDRVEPEGACSDDIDEGQLVSNDDRQPHVNTTTTIITATTTTTTAAPQPDATTTHVNEERCSTEMQFDNDNETTTTLVPLPKRKVSLQTNATTEEHEVHESPISETDTTTKSFVIVAAENEVTSRQYASNTDDEDTVTVPLPLRQQQQLPDDNMSSYGVVDREDHSVSNNDKMMNLSDNLATVVNNDDTDSMDQCELSTLHTGSNNDKMMHPSDTLISVETELYIRDNNAVLSDLSGGLANEQSTLHLRNNDDDDDVVVPLPRRRSDSPSHALDAGSVPSVDCPDATDILPVTCTSSSDQDEVKVVHGRASQLLDVAEPVVNANTASDNQAPRSDEILSTFDQVTDRLTQDVSDSVARSSQVEDSVSEMFVERVLIPDDVLHLTDTAASRETVSQNLQPVAVTIETSQETESVADSVAETVVALKSVSETFAETVSVCAEDDLSSVSDDSFSLVIRRQVQGFLDSFKPSAVVTSTDDELSSGDKPDDDDDDVEAMNQSTDSNDVITTFYFGTVAAAGAVCHETNPRDYTITSCASGLQLDSASDDRNDVSRLKTEATVDIVNRNDVIMTSHTAADAAVLDHDDICSQTSSTNLFLVLHDPSTTGISHENHQAGISAANTPAQDLADELRTGDDNEVDFHVMSDDVKTPTKNQQITGDWILSEEPLSDAPLPRRKTVEHCVGERDDVTKERAVSSTSADSHGNIVDDMSPHTLSDTKPRIENHPTEQSDCNLQNTMSDPFTDTEPEIENPPAEQSTLKIGENVEPKTVECMTERGERLMSVRRNFERSAQRESGGTDRKTLDFYDVVALKEDENDDVVKQQHINGDRSTVTSAHKEFDAVPPRITTYSSQTATMSAPSVVVVCRERQENAITELEVQEQDQKEEEREVTTTLPDIKRFQDDNNNDEKHGEMQFARASELARVFERMSAAAATISRNTSSAPGHATTTTIDAVTTTSGTVDDTTTNIPVDIGIPTDLKRTTTLAEYTATTASDAVTTTAGTTTTLSMVRSTDTLGESVRGKKPATIRDENTSVKPIQHHRQTVSTAAQSTRRGLQFVHNAKPVVIVPQPNRQQHVNDSVTNDLRSTVGDDRRWRQDVDTGMKGTGTVSVEEELNVVERTDNTSSQDDELSRVRANLRSRSARPQSTSRHFTGVKPRR